jgi:hypothetical protein
MKNLLMLSVCIVLSSITHLQADERLYSYGTLFGGFPAINYSAEIAHLGGGGGVIYKSGVGFNAEGGYIFAFENTEGVILADINANYHFLNAHPTKELIPFVTAGYSWFVPDGHQFNFGGGIDYWMNPKTGIRFEVRDHLLYEGHAMGIRAAFIFR